MISRMVMGAARSLINSSQLSPGPSHRFCLPKEILTLLSHSQPDRTLDQAKLVE